MPREVVSKFGTCCRRFPLSGEEVINLADQEGLDWFWDGHIKPMIPRVLELLEAEDLEKTAYFRWKVEQGYSPSVALGKSIEQQAMLKSVDEHGYAMTGWPVFRKNFEGKLTFVDGTHRIALQKGLGRNVWAILLEKNDGNAKSTAGL